MAYDGSPIIAFQNAFAHAMAIVIDRGPQDALSKKSVTVSFDPTPYPREREGLYSFAFFLKGVTQGNKISYITGDLVPGISGITGLQPPLLLSRGCSAAPDTPAYRKQFVNCRVPTDQLISVTESLQTFIITHDPAGELLDKVTRRMVTKTSVASMTTRTTSFSSTVAGTIATDSCPVTPFREAATALSAPQNK